MLIMIIAPILDLFGQKGGKTLYSAPLKALFGSPREGNTFSDPEKLIKKYKRSKLGDFEVRWM